MDHLSKKFCHSPSPLDISPEKFAHLLPVFQIQFALHINDLNDDCFQIVFCRFPLPKLITLRLVCSRWKAVVEAICGLKRSLKLFASFAGVESYCNRLKTYGLQNDPDFRLKPTKEGDDDLLLNISKYDLDMYYFVSTLFPNVHRLIVVYDCANKQFRQLDLPMLLDEWPQLTNLVIINFPCNDQLQRELWQTVQLKQKNLKQLHLFDARNFDLIPSDVLFRLEQASIISYVGGSQIYQFLSPNFTRLRIGDTFCSPTSLINSLKINPSLANSLTHLTIDSYLYDLGKRNMKSGKENLTQIFMFICSHFPQISYLDMISPELPFSQIVTELGRLSRLTSLKLYISSNGLTVEEEEKEKLFPLESIELLHLKVHGKHVNDQYGKWLVSLFPSVRELFVKCENPRNLVSCRMCLTEFGHLHKSLLYSDDEEVVERSRYMGRHCQRYLAKHKCECIIVPA